MEESPSLYLCVFPKSLDRLLPTKSFFLSSFSMLTAIIQKNT